MSTADTTQKLPLFDRIFRPEHIVLENGHSIDRPRSRMPLILICLAAVIIISMRATGFSFSILIERGNQLTVILGKIFHPDWSYFPKLISPLIETIKMSIIGTLS